MASSGQSPAMVGDGVRLGNLMVTPPPALPGPVIDEISMGEEGEQQI
jgi:hypothetical protein